MSRRDEVFAYMRSSRGPFPTSTDIAEATGISGRMVRKVLSAFVDEGVVVLDDDGYRLTGSEPTSPRKCGRPPQTENVGRLTPGDIASRLAEIPPDTRSLTGCLMGDPLPARSALGRTV